MCPMTDYKVVFAAQQQKHDIVSCADVSNDKIHKDLMEFVIKPVVPAKYLDNDTIFHLNPSGRHAPVCH